MSGKDQSDNVDLNEIIKIYKEAEELGKDFLDVCDGKTRVAIVLCCTSVAMSVIRKTVAETPEQLRVKDELDTVLTIAKSLSDEQVRILNPEAFDAFTNHIEKSTPLSRRSLRDQHQARSIDLLERIAKSR